MTLLCLDVGNTQLHAGVFREDTLIAQFRYPTMPAPTSDQLGVFIQQVLRHHAIAPDSIAAIALCSVVPSLDYSLRSGLVKYFNCEPFVLKPGVRTGLKIAYHSPLEVGADRIAAAIAAVARYPQRNLLIFDFGTATTCCAITADKRYLGGVIMPGMRLSMDALEQKTAKLMAGEIAKPTTVIGRSTKESIQSGLFYSQLATIKHLTRVISDDAFAEQPPHVIATGGFASLFDGLNCFDVIIGDLVLQGLKIALKNNLVT